MFLKPLGVWYFVTAALANSYKDLTEKARGRASRGEWGGGQAGAKALRQGYAPRVPGQSSGGLGREVAGGPGRWAGFGGELWLLLRDGKLLEGFGQRSETCSDLHFNRGVPAADLQLRRQAGEGVSRGTTQEAGQSFG